MPLWLAISLGLVPVVGLICTVVLWIGMEVRATEYEAMLRAILMDQRKTLDILEAILSETPITRQHQRAIRQRIKQLVKAGKAMEIPAS